MERWLSVGKLEEFPEGRGRPVVVDGVKVGVFQLKGRIYAVKDACPHMGASLADGRIVNRRVVCHWHGWSFDLETGRTDQSSWACAQIYPARVRTGWVELRVPEPPPEPEPQDEPWEVFDPERHLRGKG